MPLVATQAPAAAAVNTDVKTAQLTYVNYGGVAVTCTVTNSSSRDTTAKTASVSGYAYESPALECSDPYTTVATVTVTAKDEHGVTHSASANASTPGTLTAGLDHAVSSVQTTVKWRFLSCNPERSATCELTVAAAPK